MKLQSLKIFKTTKDMFYKQFDFFLRIDRADYGASWTLSFLPFRWTNFDLELIYFLLSMNTSIGYL